MMQEKNFATRLIFVCDGWRDFLVLKSRGRTTGWNEMRIRVPIDQRPELMKLNLWCERVECFRLESIPLRPLDSPTQAMTTVGGFQTLQRWIRLPEVEVVGARMRSHTFCQIILGKRPIFSIVKSLLYFKFKCACISFVPCSILIFLPHEDKIRERQKV